MNRVILAILFTLLMALFAAQSRADNSVELIGPGLSWHVMNSNAGSLNSNKVSNDGRLLYTPEFGVRKTYIEPTGLYKSVALFTAQNSIGSPVYGGMLGTGLEFKKMFSAGLILGGYVQNNEDFRYKGITPFSVTGGENAFVPLAGFEFNFKLYLSKNVFLGQNNIITPIISNHNLSLGIRF